MKRITLLTLIVIFLSFTACDKEASAPQKVKDAFAQKFPNATDVEWEKESDTEWEAEFKFNGKEHSSNFIQDGTWVETEYEISESQIPPSVLNALKTNFEGYEIEKRELSTTADGTVYEFEIEKGESEMEIVIDSSGTILKKENKQEDEDDEDDEMDND